MAVARPAGAGLSPGSGIGAAVEPARLSLAGASRAAVERRAPPAPEEEAVAMHLLMPKRIVRKKPHKPAIKPFRHSTKWKFRGFATKGVKPVFGKFALQALEEAWINNKTIEASRRAMTREMKRQGKIWIRVFPHSAITERVAESRMGAGKGAIEYWCAAIRPNFILFEMDGVDEEVARNAFRKVASKLPCKSRFLRKTDGPSRFELGLAGTAGRNMKRARMFERFRKE